MYLTTCLTSKFGVTSGVVLLLTECYSSTGRYKLNFLPLPSSFQYRKITWSHFKMSFPTNLLISRHQKWFSVLWNRLLAAFLLLVQERKHNCVSNWKYRDYQLEWKYPHWNIASDNWADIPALMKNDLWRHGFTASFLYSTWELAPALDLPWHCAGEQDGSELRTPQMEATPPLPNPICSWRFLSRHWLGPILFQLRNLPEAQPRHVLAQPVRQTSQRVSARPGQ